MGPTLIAVLHRRPMPEFCCGRGCLSSGGQGSPRGVWRVSTATDSSIPWIGVCHPLPPARRAHMEYRVILHTTRPKPHTVDWPERHTAFIRSTYI
ncbi:hypothetical protein AAFF_G00419420 [Aldrovandia affinis]|uniref:Uncharacterized protein n=1 Tax=Aldrovandia affinis TaxID=143900 RepID=A0AAD7WJA4_9TELE|nr:hypothetical protein AAFF_G00419420 [Aldrovandia affinis]